MAKFKNYLIILIVPILFLIVSVFTIRDYGINWDSPIHFIRGQAYLEYYLTGKPDYAKDSQLGSYFQNRSFPTSYFLENDGAHPPLSDIFSAISNHLFYQKLHILSDINSYNFFIIVTSFIFVVVVAIFAYQAYGLPASIFSALALSSYPLFFAESHFNIKDPPEAAFIALTIWLFWLSLTKKNWKVLLLSGFACGLALSTKLNVVFLPFIIFPYLIVRYWPLNALKRKEFWNLPLVFKLAAMLVPVIAFLVLLASWPFLWGNVIPNIIHVISYYKDIGTGSNTFPGYALHGGINLYPIFWILTTTPPFIIVLTLFGLLAVYKRWRENDKTSLLWLLWFIVPIARVSVPNSSIYGGIRQIFEYIPAMALLSGLGGQMVVDLIKPFFKKWSIVVLLLCFIPQIVVLIKLHPNQNVYFNFIVGGLEGAKKRAVPYWGNSYGNSYWQAIKWINKNVEKGAKLALVQGTALNIPAIQLRQDIDFYNMNWSGIYRHGEYLVEMIFDYRINPFPYAWEYIDRLLEPVYEVKADGVAIAKVWKNDLEHTKPEFRKNEVRLWNFRTARKGNQINFVFDKPVTMTRLFLHYLPGTDCQEARAKIESSFDGSGWVAEKESLPAEQVTVDNLISNIYPFFFAARDLKYLRVTVMGGEKCLLNGTYFDFWGLN